MAKRSGKNLSSEDRRLWKQVTDTVTPRQFNSFKGDEEFLAAMQNIDKQVKNSTPEIKKSNLSKVVMPSFSFLSR